MNTLISVFAYLSIVPQIKWQKFFSQHTIEVLSSRHLQKKEIIIKFNENYQQSPSGIMWYTVLLNTGNIKHLFWVYFIPNWIEETVYKRLLLLWFEKMKVEMYTVTSLEAVRTSR